jgi:hypothetical protein
MTMEHKYTTTVHPTSAIPNTSTLLSQPEVQKLLERMKVVLPMMAPASRKIRVLPTYSIVCHTVCTVSLLHIRGQA